MQNILTEFSINENVTGNQLIKFGFKLRSNNTYFLDKYLFRTIKVKFIADMEEKTLTWSVYDCMNQQKYYAFYNNINGDNNLVAIKTIESFNGLIDEMVRENIITDEETENEQ